MEEDFLKNLLAKGYILLPKAMLENSLTQGTQPLSEFEATLLLICRVNYRDVTCVVAGKSQLCPRGESLQSVNTWAELFRWNRSRTRRFLSKLAQQGIIELLPHSHTTHLRVPHYEAWTGFIKQSRNGVYSAEKEFDDFWEHYHLTTGTRKVNVGRARREWNRMSQEERKQAYGYVDNYYYNLKDVRYCKQAATYLKDKTYLDED